MAKNQYQQRKQDKESAIWEQYLPLKSSVLIPLLDDKDAITRLSVARILQLRGGKEIMKLAEKFCLAPQYRRRAIGAFILGQIKVSGVQEMRIFNLLHQLALNDSSAIVRSDAVASTTHRCIKNSAFSSILAKQSTFTAFDKAVNVRYSTAFALSAINDPSTIPLALKLLNDPNGDVRNWAAFAINTNEYDSPEIRDRFIPLLSDSNEEARTEAIVGLAYRHDQRVANHLRKELEKSTVYDEMIIATGELGDNSFIPLLQNMLDRFDDNDGLIQSSLNKLIENGN